MFNSGFAAPSLADIAAVTGNNRNNDGMWGGDGWWAIIIFAMIFGWGNGGWGGFGGNGNGVQGALTRGELCQDMNFQSLENAVRGVQQGLCDGFYAQNTNLLTGFSNLQNTIQNGFAGVDNAVCTLGYNMQQGFNTMNVANMQNTNALQAQLADCCCTTQRAIDGINYNMATNTCAITNQMNNNTRDIIDSQNAGTRAILDYLCQDKIATLQQENQSLRLAASQSAQNNYLLSELKPCPQPAYITCNPFTGQYGGYNGYGYGQGCNQGCGCC